ncbi:MAG TPA: glycosyltransferase family 1 protein [Candidatus Methylomirabilis sp.]|nr:glycosyltransferase family 1 protein [Candidatus Methylomirabilis sp.]
MRIALDLSLVPGQRVGVGQYAYQLARALARVDQVNSYVLYPVFYFIVNPDYDQTDLPTAPNMRVAHRRLSPRVVRHLWRRERSDEFKEYLLGRANVVHSTTFCAPRFRAPRRRLVTTIHDCTFVTHPEFHIPANIDHCLHGTRLAIERADALIAVSESTRRDLIERLEAPADRIVVTHEAADPDLARVTDADRLDAVRRRYDLPERFVLFLGSMEPRQNLLRLLEAFAALAPSLREEFKLVVAGAQGWLNESVHEQVRKLGLGDSACFPGYIEQDDVAALYSLATVFTYPSLWEGFGLPVLEAMACGAPVLTSNVSSMPEVAGDAALLVPPTDVDAMADGLTRLLEDGALRADLAVRGSDRAAQFSWDRCARETLAVYQTVVG